MRMMPTLRFNILLVVNLPPPERGKGTAKRYQQAKKTEETEEACRTEGLNIKKSLRFFLAIWELTCWQILIKNKWEEKSLNSDGEPGLAVVARLGQFWGRLGEIRIYGNTCGSSDCRT